MSDYYDDASVSIDAGFDDDMGINIDALITKVHENFKKKIDLLGSKIDEFSSDKIEALEKLFGDADADRVIEVMQTVTKEDIEVMNKEEAEALIMAMTVEKVITKEDILKELDADIAEIRELEVDNYYPDEYAVFVEDESITRLDGKKLEEIKSMIKEGKYSSINVFLTPRYSKIDNIYCVGISAWVPYDVSIPTTIYEVTKETLEELYLLRSHLRKVGE